MAPYNQYNNFYETVGSQSSNQPSGYTYQHPAPTSGSQYPSTSATANYTGSSYPSYGTGYNAQQYGTTAQQASNENTGTNRVAAAALSSLSGQEYGQHASRSANTQQQSYDGYSSQYPSQSSSAITLQPPSRTIASATPSATFGSLSYNAPSTSTQRSSSAYGQQTSTPAYGQQSAAQSYASGSANTSTAHSYQPSYATATAQAHGQTEPQRYASPLQAVRAQQHQQSQSAQSSRHQPSLQINSQPPPQTNKQPSASVEPASTTVDPSQVYDFRAEREKKAKIEAEKRRKVEEAEAARKVEQDRIDAEKAEEIRRQKAAENARKLEEAQKLLAKREKQAARVQKTAAGGAVRKAEQRRIQEEQQVASENNQSETAANALTQMASSGSDANLPPPANAEEAEMREMFKKMREFNSRNPAMLAKLWEEERRSHAVSQSPQPAPAAQPAPPPQQAAPATPSVPNTSAPRAAAPPATKPFTIPRKNAQPHSIKKTAAAKAQEKAQAPPQAPAQSPSQGSGSSLWPPGKKGFLAEIAAQWLSARNPNRPVTKQEVLHDLDKNPNYVQLCEALEGLGLKFERAGFARELLRAVPSSTQASQNTPKPAEAAMMNANGTASQAGGTPDGQPEKKKRGRPKGSATKMRDNPDWKPLSNGTVNYEMPSFSLTAAAQRLNNMDRLPAPSPNQANQPAMGGPVQPSQGTDNFISIHDDTPPPPAEPTPEVKPASPPRPPADKEEAARKRGFSDLVDLAAGDSEDEDSAPPPKKMMQMAQGQAAQGMGFTQRQNADGSMGERTWMMPYELPQQAAPPQQATMPPARMLPSNGNIGSPSMPPPPAHLPQPPQPQQTVQVPPPQPKRKGPTQEQLQHDRVRGKMVVEPIMRDRVARKSTYDVRTIARDVLLATGRHPDMRALNSHMNPMQRLLGERGGMLDQTGNKADLATIRWDIIDPESVNKVPPPTDKPIDVDAGDADDEDDMPAPAMSAMARQQVVDGGDGTMRYVLVSEANPMKSTRRHGRKSRQSALGGISLAPGGGDASGTPRQSVQPRGTPNTAPANRTAAPSATGTPTGALGYSAFRKLDADGNPIKTKGRPVGWRKSVHSREAQGLTPAKPVGKPVGRPKKESPLQEPKYQVYKCMWLDCKAELHTLDTLKKHIVKVHGHPDDEGVYSCLWQGCQARSTDSSRNGKAKARTAAFTDIEPWINHVNLEHLQDIAYKLGDGPRGGQSGYPDSGASEAYLSDSHGRSVTPIIRPFEALNTIGEEGSSRVAPAPLRSRAREDAEREIGKLADRKRAVGPTLDRQGVRFANAKRRLGFLDDEDFEDIVQSEGEGEE